MNPEHSGVEYEFGRFRLNIGDYLLMSAGKPVPLPPKVFELLVVLVDHRGHTVEKEKLIQILWPNVFVEESSLTQLVFQLRRALGEGSSINERYIETIPKRGYRFAAEVKLVPGDLSHLVIRSRVGTQILIEEEQKSEDPVIVHHHKEESPQTLDNLDRSITLETTHRASMLDRRSLFSVTAVAAFVLIAVLASIWSIKWQVSRSATHWPFQRVSHRKLTASGKAVLPAISPDGSYAAYVVNDSGNQGLWVRQIATTSRVQIIQPAEVEYRGVTFSADGQFVYYVQSQKDSTNGVLFQIPVLGGTPRKVIGEVDSPVTFSPDGKQFSFVRVNQAVGQTSLMIANSDGTGVRVIASRKAPEYFSNKGPAWSPVGQIIAVGVGKSEHQRSYAQVVTISAAQGTENVLPSQTWAEIGQVSWLDEGGIVINAWPENSDVYAEQLWYLRYPSGEAQRVMPDLVSYEGIAIANKADILVAGRSQRISRVWVSSVTKTDDARQIKSGMGDNHSELFGLDWTSQGRIVYSSHGGGNSDIWIMDGDGRNQRQLTYDKRRETWPVVSADSRFIVFVSEGEDGTHIWHMDAGGNNPKQLTFGKGEDHPSLSPDGRWVFFTSMDLGWPTVARVPIEGGQPSLLTQGRASRPVVAPDGQKVACFFLDDRLGRMIVAVIPLDGGTPQMYPSIPMPDWDLLRWSPKGDGLTYVITRDGVSNVWVQPLVGGPPQKLTNFKEDRIYRFAWSPDGTTLALDRGFDINDIIVATTLK